MRRREGLLDGVPQPEEWSWAADRLELVEAELGQELSTPEESRPTRTDDTSLRSALDLVREARAAVDAGDPRAARTAWEGVADAVRCWDDGPTVEQIRSTGVALFGGPVEVPVAAAPPTILTTSAAHPGTGRRRRDARPPSRRDLVVRVVLCTIAVVLTSAGAVVGVGDAVRQYRADTPVRAPADGCEATVTGRDGVPRTVSLRVYKGACLQPGADGRVTVYVDADDPSVVAPRRWWVWWASVATVLAGLAVLAARSAARAVTELTRGRDLG